VNVRVHQPCQNEASWKWLRLRRGHSGEATAVDEQLGFAIIVETDGT